MEKVFNFTTKSYTDYYYNMHKKSINSICCDYLNFVLTYKSDETYSCYEGHLMITINYLRSTYNIKYDLDITEKMLYNFIRFQRDNKLSEATINKRINVFKRAFNYSSSKLDLSYLKSLKEKYVTFKNLIDNEINLLVKYLVNSNMSVRNKLIVFLLLESGIRRKELFKIEIRNIDLINDMILLNFTKTNEPRYVCFDFYTKKYLELYLKECDPINKYLFYISKSAFDSIFKRIKNALKFQHFSAYVLRHTYATIIINNDGNIEMLKNTMGHKKLSTTQRYIHYNIKLLKLSYKKSFKI